MLKIYSEMFMKYIRNHRLITYYHVVIGQVSVGTNTIIEYETVGVSS